jgi:hypothetical protein
VTKTSCKIVINSKLDRVSSNCFPPVTNNYGNVALSAFADYIMAFLTAAVSYISPVAMAELYNI